MWTHYLHREGVMKKLFLTLLLVPFLLVGCKKGSKTSSEEQYINVEVSELTLMEDDTYQIETSVIKSGTIVFYSSANDKIASVNDDGLITAIKAGETTITVRGGKDSYNIFVTVTPFQAHDSLQIVMEKESYTLAVNDEYVLPLQVKIGNQVVEGATLDFTIENPAVLSINGLLVKALSAGTTKCVATASYQEEVVSKGFTVTVY